MTIKLGQEDRKWIAWLITVGLVVVGTLVGAQFPIPPLPADNQIDAAGTTHFTNVSAEDLAATDDLTVGDDATITDALSAADLAATDDLTVGDDATITGIANIGEWPEISSTDEVSATADFVPTQSYNTLEASAAVTLAITTTAMTPGSLIYLTNKGANRIELADSSPHALSALMNLDTGDAIMLLFNGTVWTEVSRSNN